MRHSLVTFNVYLNTKYFWHSIIAFVLRIGHFFLSLFKISYRIVRTKNVWNQNKPNVNVLNWLLLFIHFFSLCVIWKWVRCCCFCSQWSVRIHKWWNIWIVWWQHIGISNAYTKKKNCRLDTQNKQTASQKTERKKILKFRRNSRIRFFFLVLFDNQTVWSKVQNYFFLGEGVLVIIIPMSIPQIYLSASGSTGPSTVVSNDLRKFQSSSKENIRERLNMHVKKRIQGHDIIGQYPMPITSPASSIYSNSISASQQTHPFLMAGI